MEMTSVVRKWHLAAHILECFSKFTLNFVEGAGQVEGKILETLWSGMDEVEGLAQAMSIAHHQEVVDEYMNDSNWQKIIQIGRKQYFMLHSVALTLPPADSLCGKWRCCRLLYACRLLLNNPLCIYISEFGATRYGLQEIQNNKCNLKCQKQVQFRVQVSKQ